MAVHNLVNIARDNCIQVLLGQKEDVSTSHMVSLLSTDHFTSVSELILNRIIDLYPCKLTNSILCCTAPPHMKQLSLKKCLLVTPRGLQQVLDRCRVVKINLSDNNLLVAPDLFSICSRSAPNLTSLNLENTDIVDRAIHNILKYFPNLKHLGVSSCNEITDNAFLIDEHAQLTQERRKAAPKMLSGLTNIDVSACQKISSMGIRNIVTLCGPTLQHLDMSWTKADCMALWYLGGYSFNSAVFLAMNISKLQGHSFEEILHECDLVMKKCLSNEICDNHSCDMSSQQCNNSSSATETQSHSIIEDSNLGPIPRNTAASTLNSMLQNVKLEETGLTQPSQENSDINLVAMNTASSQLVSFPTISKSETFGEEKFLEVEDNSPLTPSPSVKHDYSDKDTETSSSSNSPPSCDDSSFDTASSDSDLPLPSLTSPKLKWYEPALVSLNASSVDFSHEHLNLLCLKAFFLSNSELRKLTLSWKNLSDEMLEYIAKCCNKLTDLSLLDCERLTTRGLLSFHNHCKEIISLNLRGVLHSDNFCAVIPLLTDNIRNLDLSECDVTDIIVNTISKNCCKTLKYLDLSWCENVTQMALERLVKSCNQLQTLILHQCEVTPRVIDSLSTTCHQITKLSLFMVRDITDESVVLFSKHLPLLADIDLSWNDRLTDASIEGILVNCLYLQRLSAAGLKSMTSKALIPIIGDYLLWRSFLSLLSIKKLESHVLTDDERFSSSDDEYEALYLPHRSSSYATNLRYINLNYSDHVDDTDLNHIAYCCQGSIHIIDYYGYEVVGAVNSISVPKLTP